MTGYGQAMVESECCRVSVVVRTVNHKFLDIALRLPEAYRQEEARIREHIGLRLKRGRVEVRFDIEDLRQHDARIELNRALIDRLSSAIEDWKGDGLVVGELTLRDLIRIPDAIRIATEHSAADSEMVKQLFSALDGALATAKEARRFEGEKLRKRVSTLLDEMLVEVDLIEAQESEIVKDLSDRYKQRLEGIDLGGLQVEEGRVVQEIALLIEKADVREEIDRLHTHVEHFRSAMIDDGPIGRRLDFLTQEMFRELTTLATKCRHSSVTQPAIDGKLICEQIREQVQNLE
jgi:uncharacterized protein (TIGR00255 family)